MDEASSLKIGKNVHNDSVPRRKSLWRPLLILNDLPALRHQHFRSVLATAAVA